MVITAKRAVATFAGYAIDRFVARMVYSIATKRGMKNVKHVQTLASVATSAIAYFGAKHYEKTAEYADEITMGTFVGTFQTVVQNYAPAKINWIVSDIKAEDYSPMKNPDPLKNILVDKSLEAIDLSTGEPVNYDDLDDIQDLLPGSGDPIDGIGDWPDTDELAQLEE